MEFDWSTFLRRNGPLNSLAQYYVDSSKQKSFSIPHNLRIMWNPSVSFKTDGENDNKISQINNEYCK